MKYQVIYYKNKKKKTAARLTAIFYSIEDASLWEQHVQKQGYLNSEIVPVFNH
jgi:hypothetical protein